jgi:hypothetical protein
MDFEVAEVVSEVEEGMLFAKVGKAPSSFTCVHVSAVSMDRSKSKN